MAPGGVERHRGRYDRPSLAEASQGLATQVGARCGSWHLPGGRFPPVACTWTVAQSQTGVSLLAGSPGSPVWPDSLSLGRAHYVWSGLRGVKENGRRGVTRARGGQQAGPGGGWKPPGGAQRRSPPPALATPPSRASQGRFHSHMSQLPERPRMLRNPAGGRGTSWPVTLRSAPPTSWEPASA